MTITEQIEYSVHPPNPYICTHSSRLLPDWSVPVLSVLLVLQRCQCSLTARTVETEANKNYLRRRFLVLGTDIALTLIAMEQLAELFDPKTGLPVLSLPGSLKVDDVAIAHAILRYPITRNGRCSTLIHPHWDTAVYPSTLVSSAPPQMLAEVANAFMGSGVIGGDRVGELMGGEARLEF